MSDSQRCLKITESQLVLTILTFKCVDSLHSKVKSIHPVVRAQLRLGDSLMLIGRWSACTSNVESLSLAIQARCLLLWMVLVCIHHPPVCRDDLTRSVCKC